MKKYYIYDKDTKLYKGITLSKVENSTEIEPPKENTKYYYFDGNKWVLNKKLLEQDLLTIEIKHDGKIKEFIDDLQQKAFNVVTKGDLTIQQLERYNTKLKLVEKAEMGDEQAIDLLNIEAVVRNIDVNTLISNIKEKANLYLKMKEEIIILLEAYRVYITKNNNLRFEKETINNMIKQGAGFDDIVAYIKSKILKG